MSTYYIATVYINEGWAAVIMFIVLIYAVDLYTESKKNKKENVTLRQTIKENEITSKQKEAELKVHFQNWAIGEFNKFKTEEIEMVKRAAMNTAIESAKTLLKEWKITSEAEIRQDAINRSYSVNLGKITEHLVPFHKSFLSQFNPKDARFIGSPIDLLVFDGYADKKDEYIIYFVEVKTGNSKLTEVQKKVKEAVKDLRIRWAEVNPDDEVVIKHFEKKTISQLSINYDLDSDKNNKPDDV